MAVCGAWVRVAWVGVRFKAAHDSSTTIYCGERDASLAAVAPANPRSSLLISRSEKRPDLPSSSMRRKDIVPPPQPTYAYSVSVHRSWGVSEIRSFTRRRGLRTNTAECVSSLECQYANSLYSASGGAPSPPQRSSQRRGGGAPPSSHPLARAPPEEGAAPGALGAAAAGSSAKAMTAMAATAMAPAVARAAGLVDR